MLSMIRAGDMSSAVYQLQVALKQCGYHSVTADGSFGATTEAAVRHIQGRLNLTPDGIVGPATIRALKLDLSPKTLTVNDIRAAAERVNCDPRVIAAICEVEAPKGGFNADGTPVILYERHYFDKLFVDGDLLGKNVEEQTAIRATIRATQRDICWPRALSFAKVDKAGNPIAAIDRYGPSNQQYDRLNRARRYSDTAALMSASWGKFQIMGENYRRIGWKSVQAFVRAMQASERDHLDAMVGFLYSKPGLVQAVRGKDWRAIAKLYNGPSQVAHYAPKLQAAYARS